MLVIALKYVRGIFGFERLIWDKKFNLNINKNWTAAVIFILPENSVIYSCCYSTLRKSFNHVYGKSGICSNFLIGLIRILYVIVFSRYSTGTLNEYKFVVVFQFLFIYINLQNNLKIKKIYAKFFMFVKLEFVINLLTLMSRKTCKLCYKFFLLYRTSRVHDILIILV